MAPSFLVPGELDDGWGDLILLECVDPIASHPIIVVICLLLVSLRRLR